MHTDLNVISIDEIKKGYKGFLCDLEGASDGDMLAKLFLSNVLGYDTQSDLIMVNISKYKNKQEPLPPQRPVKFYFEWFQKGIEANDIKSAGELALFAHVNVFIITDWKRLFIYDQEDAESPAELLYSIDFREDGAYDAAAKFWVLSRKDCNKTILINSR